MLRVFYLVLRCCEVRVFGSRGMALLEGAELEVSLGLVTLDSVAAGEDPVI